MKPAALGDRSWISAKAELLHKFQFFNLQRVLPGCGHPVAPWSDDVAKIFVFNSMFQFAGEESDLKFGPVE